MLEVKHLNGFYGKSHILWDINIKTPKNKVTALVGRNGMGKTTTLKCIMGLIKIRKGSINIDNVQVINKQPYQISKLGVSYVPDDMGIFPTLSVEENILIAKHISKRKGIWDLETIYSLFPKLSQIKHSRAGNLSGGEKKMLSIGRALASNPKLILIDEPTEGLAPLIVQNLINAIRKIKDLGTTILLTDQNLNFVKRVADYFYIIEEGRIKYEGTTEKLLKQEEDVLKYLAV